MSYVVYLIYHMYLLFILFVFVWRNSISIYLVKIFTRSHNTWRNEQRIPEQNISSVWVRKYVVWTTLLSIGGTFPT